MDKNECYRLTHPCRKFLATPLPPTSKQVLLGVEKEQNAGRRTGGGRKERMKGEWFYW